MPIMKKGKMLVYDVKTRKMYEEEVEVEYPDEEMEVMQYGWNNN